MIDPLKSSRLQFSFRTSLKGVILSLIFLFGHCLSPVYAQNVNTSFGTNVEPTLYYNPDGMYVDLFMHSSNWWNGPNPIALTTAGYPASGSATCLMQTAGYPSGNYQFYGEGDFTFDVRGGSTDGIVPNSLKKVGNTTTALVHLSTSPVAYGGFPGGSSQSGFLFDVNVNDASNPPANFHLIRPEYPAWPNTNATFGKEFLQTLKPFTCLRMMDWMGTNGSTVTNWASRPQPEVFGCFNAGAAYERFIELANTTNRDLWINIPVYATDDYIIGMAKLLKANLKPGLHVYYEYSNEMWNWSFSQWAVVENWGLANSALTISAANGGAWLRHGQEMAFLLMHTISIMQPVLGSQGRPVLSGQMADTVYTSAGLSWIQQQYGPPANYIYGIGGATYFGSGGTSVDDVIANTSAGIDSWLTASLLQWQSLAGQYNVKLCCYEGSLGFDTSDQNSFNLYTAVQLDPRMIPLFQKYAKALNAGSVDLAMFFNCINDWSQYGTWGAVTDDREIANPPSKYVGEAAIANSGNQNDGATVNVNSGKLHNTEMLPHAHNTEMTPHAHNTNMEPHAHNTEMAPHQHNTNGKH